MHQSHNKWGCNLCHQKTSKIWIYFHLDYNQMLNSFEVVADFGGGLDLVFDGKT